VRLLLDTHVFLRWIEGSYVSAKAHHAMANADNELVLSLASIWEIAIRLSVGKLRIPAPFERHIPRQLALNQITQLEIGFRHVARVAKMPFHHRDPFDRLIIAQSL